MCLGCLLGCGAGSECMYCADDLFMNDDAFFENEVLSCVDGYYIANESSKRFEKNDKGCAKNGMCCLRIISNQNQSSFGHDNYFRCNDPCKLHINWLSMFSKSIYNWTTWSNQSEYKLGRLLGGKVCSINRSFGYCLLIPISLNWLFVMKLWSNDFRKQMTRRRTFVFGVTATYPIILVMKYLGNWKNKEQMDQQKERFEREVATAEGYLESILQVIDYLHITLELLN